MIDIANKQIIYFDGVCNLCTGTVQFFLKHNKKQNLLFASLQSNAGQEMLQYFNLPQNNFNSFVFVENGKLFQRSTAALKAIRHLNGLWPFLYGFVIVPKFIRDAVYSYIAKNRYKWFGEKNECWLPTPEIKKRFL